MRLTDNAPSGKLAAEFESKKKKKKKKKKKIKKEKEKKKKREILRRDCLRRPV